MQGRVDQATSPGKVGAGEIGAGEVGDACKGSEKCTRCPGPKCGRVEFKMPACGLRAGQEESCES